jgi:hypothetical protein
MSGSYFYHHWRDFGENNQRRAGLESATWE